MDCRGCGQATHVEKNPWGPDGFVCQQCERQRRGSAQTCRPCGQTICKACVEALNKARVDEAERRRIEALRENQALLQAEELEMQQASARDEERRNAFLADLAFGAISKEEYELHTGRLGYDTEDHAATAREPLTVVARGAESGDSPRAESFSARPAQELDSWDPTAQEGEDGEEAGSVVAAVAEAEQHTTMDNGDDLRAPYMVGPGHRDEHTIESAAAERKEAPSPPPPQRRHGAWAGDSSLRLSIARVPQAGAATGARSSMQGALDAFVECVDGDLGASPPDEVEYHNARRRLAREHRGRDSGDEMTAEGPEADLAVVDAVLKVARFKLHKERAERAKLQEELEQTKAQLLRAMRTLTNI